MNNCAGHKYKQSMHTLRQATKLFIRHIPLTSCQRSYKTHNRPLHEQSNESVTLSLTPAGTVNQPDDLRVEQLHTCLLFVFPPLSSSFHRTRCLCRKHVSPLTIRSERP